MTNLLEIFLLLLILPSMIISEDEYLVTPIQTSPGIYYEKLHNMRFKRATWQIMLFLDIKQIQEQFPREVQHLKAIYSGCKMQGLESQCDSILRLEYLKSKIRTAETCLEEIKEAILDLKATPVDTYPKTFVRRSVPFGFIGSLSHTLFGTLNEDDAESFNQEIDKLYTDQRKITQLVKNQTHIVATGLHNLHDLTVQNNQRIKENRIKIVSLNNRVGVLAQTATMVNYTLELMLYGNTVETAVEHYIQTARKFIEAIYAAREGRLLSTLLTGVNLGSILQDIQNAHTDLELPISRSYHRIEEITKISTVTPSYHNGRMFIILQLPLVDRKSYHLCRMHSWPIPQNISTNRTASAYIIPRYPYIGLSTDHGTYFMAAESYLQSCYQTWYCHLCPLELPLHEVASSRTCEISLLVRPSSQSLRQCDIRVKPRHESHWARLTSIGAWLYSVENTETLQIFCNSGKNVLIEISGTGIVQLKPNCVGKTQYTTLIGIQTFESKEQYLYKPNLLLNLTNISPKIHQYHQLRPDKLQEGNLPVHTIPENTEESLYEIENKLEEIGEHHRERAKQLYLTYGGIFGQTTLIILAVTLFCFRSTLLKLWQGLQCCTKLRNHTEPIRKSFKKKKENSSSLEMTPSSENSTIEPIGTESPRIQMNTARQGVELPFQRPLVN